MIDVIGGAAIIACLCMIALGLVILVLGDSGTRRGGAMWLVRGLVLLGVVLLAASLLGGCAPPPPTGDAVLDVDLDDAVVPSWLWLGADHPEWASCRLEPPSALCTEP